MLRPATTTASSSGHRPSGRELTTEQAYLEHYPPAPNSDTPPPCRGLDCPTGPQPSVRMTHAAVAGVHIAGWSQAIGVRRPRPLSACPDPRCPPAAPAYPG